MELGGSELTACVKQNNDEDILPTRKMVILSSDEERSKSTQASTHPARGCFTIDGALGRLGSNGMAATDTQQPIRAYPRADDGGGFSRNSDRTRASGSLATLVGIPHPSLRVPERAIGAFGRVKWTADFLRALLTVFRVNGNLLGTHSYEPPSRSRA